VELLIWVGLFEGVLAVSVAVSVFVSLLPSLSSFYLAGLALALMSVFCKLVGIECREGFRLSAL
jgi:hypothetical protein